MSKWQDAVVHTAVFHMQCNHYTGINKPPSFYDYEPLNHHFLTRERERTHFAQLDEWDQEAKTEKNEPPHSFPHPGMKEKLNVDASGEPVSTSPNKSCLRRRYLYQRATKKSIEIVKPGATMSPKRNLIGLPHQLRLQQQQQQQQQTNQNSATRAFQNEKSATSIFEVREGTSPADAAAAASIAALYHRHANASYDSNSTNQRVKLQQ